MSMTTGLTGGTGFLGRRLVRRLLSEGRHVRCLVRPSSDVGPLLELARSEPGRIEIQRGSLADSADAQRFLTGTDVVYHCAAALTGSAATLFLNTVVPTRSLADAAARCGVQRFVLISSLAVYGTSALKAGSVLTESCPIEPHGERRDPYTFSKIRQEQLAWQAHSLQGLPLVVVRPGVIYGPERSLLSSRVGLQVGRWFVRMGGGQRLPYIHVENCAAAVVRAGESEGIEGNAFNLVDDELPTGRQILQRLAQQGPRTRPIWIPRPLIGPLSSMYEACTRWSDGQLPPVITRYRSSAIWKPLCYSNAKAKRCLNWFPEFNWNSEIHRERPSNGAFERHLRTPGRTRCP